MKWSRDTEELLGTALEHAFERRTGERLFTAGDVNVAMALPWYEDPDEMENSVLGPSTPIGDHNAKLGVRVIIEISMFNPLAGSKKNTYIETMLSNFTDHFQSRKHQCTEEDLFPLAKNASRAKTVLGESSFFHLFIDELQSMEASKLDPFGPLRIDKPSNASSSRVLTVWTIRTRVEDEVNFFGPQRPLLARLLSLLQVVLVMSASPFVLLSLGNVLSNAQELFLNYRRHGRRMFSRSPQISRVENPNDVENSIIMGTDNVHVTYKVTRPSKRTRSFAIERR